MTNPKRHLRNFLLFPGSQIRHGVAFVGVTTFFHLVLTGLAIVLVDSWLAGRTGVATLPFWQVAAVIVILYLAFLTFIFLFGLFMSHKWIGPIYAIERYVTALVGGDYSKRIGLRKNALPQFHRLANALNVLAGRLEKNHVPDKQRPSNDS